MAKIRLYLPEQICLKAVEGGLAPGEAAEMFLDAVDQEFLEFCCSGHEVLYETPEASERENYNARLMAFFVKMLDEFTAPIVTQEPPLTFPIPRSAPDAK